ncbi:MAG: hypothetical protein KDB95_10010 [Flavobacteriales bacterium]|nr:hypothetical protein [Flavobacteriales bacterium]
MPLIVGMLATNFLGSPSVLAQGSTDHLPGKVYVIRITPMETDSLLMEEYVRTKVDPVLIQPMFVHIKQNLYRMRSASDGRWFVGYFHADRQEREVLLRDSDLLTWLLHGHEVQILPIEAVRSPIEVPQVASPDR